MQIPDEGSDPARADIPESDPATPGVSRRSLMRGAVGVGAATVAAGFLASALAEPAAATAATGGPDAAGTPTEPVVAHVRDAHTGQVDLFVGTRHIRVHDRDLAARLTNAAR